MKVLFSRTLGLVAGAAVISLAMQIVPQRTCEDGTGGQCTNVSNQCTQDPGFCTRCTATGVGIAGCTGEFDSCATHIVSAGCGNWERASCDGSTCENWVVTQWDCPQLACGTGE